MTFRDRKASRALFLLSGALSGVLLADHAHFILHFYERSGFDVALVFIFFILAIFVGQRLIKKQVSLEIKGIAVVLQGLLVVYTLPLEYLMISKTLYAIFISYLTTLCSGAVLSLFLPARRYSLPLKTLGIILLLGSLVTRYFYPTFPIYYFITITIIVTSFVSFPRPFALSATLLSLIMALFLIPPEITYYPSQKNYADKVILSFLTPFTRVDVTEWKGHYWFYYNGKNQWSSLDAAMYSESLVHPPLMLAPSPDKVLVIGGENGLALREIVKHPDIKQVDFLPIDAELVAQFTQRALFQNQHQGIYDHDKISLKTGEVFHFLYQSKGNYDVIICDIPDPVDIETNQWFTVEFFQLAIAALNERGTFVTQSGSPYLAPEAFRAIGQAMRAAGFSPLPYHNQVPSIGEWGWHLAQKDKDHVEVKKQLLNGVVEVPTRWLNQEALKMVLSFGKMTDSDTAINTLEKPVIHQLYNNVTR